MEDLYDADPIPDEAALNAAFEQHHDRTGAGGGIGLDLSAHSSGVDSSLLSSFSSTSAADSFHNGATDRRGCGGSVARRPREKHQRLGTRRVREAALESPATVSKRLEESIAAAEMLRKRIEGVALLHRKNDFVRGERCANSGCAVVGLRKFSSRIACEARNAHRALEQLRNVFPGVAGGMATTPDELASTLRVPECRAVLVAAQQIAECNSLAHLELIVRCLETERDVVGAGVPVMPPVGMVQGATTTTSPSARSASRVLLEGDKAEEARDKSADGVAGSRSQTRLEVDVVSANGLRWIKIRSAAPTPIEERATCDVGCSQSDTELIETMREYMRRARSVKFAFREQVEVAILFGQTPSPSLIDALTALGVSVASASEHDALITTAPLTEALEIRHLPFFPPRPLLPAFICLDTTALVCLCSETCYPSELSIAQREENLKRYKVLSDQIRSEARQTAVLDSGVMEEALKQFTTWDTLSAFEERMELMLREPLASGLENPEALAESARWRHTYAPVSASLAQTAWCDKIPKKGSSAEPPVESSVVCDIDAERERRGTLVEAGHSTTMFPRPNWIITDVSYHEFRWMVETIAGRSEILRAQRLLRNVMVVDTSFLRKLPLPCEELAAKGHVLSYVQCLPASAKIQQRNRIVFACADALHAVVLTANKRVVNSAREHGIHLWARLHPSRSLTELYMHGERRHPGLTRPLIRFDVDNDEDEYFCV